jgi:thiamine pyrophosphate-dependent acetolactate synthase large subunit-like protein
VVCVTGDGAFGINAMEIDTAVRHGAKIVVIVSNNATTRLGTSSASIRRQTMGAE